MTIPIDDATFPDEHVPSSDETKQGNPGRPQSEFENPPQGPSDEPPDGADRSDGHDAARSASTPTDPRGEDG